ncbi:hypothetical protein LGH70_13215 [Hymenobacter sp. BT635]|uniref:Uncharacterized protein n=1 Tax=Hymenobacter nitidus TaxID=2880929 RepID=A0ABS8ADQ4_9BACT|nr:hypothetical protein [Hymenobacter nitidus]MCB2378553.1 hypothetical protein [Hymenobacter nitidus]
MMLPKHFGGLLLVLLSATHAPAQTAAPRPGSAPTPKILLQGIWAENTEDNALFFVRGNHLTYVEFLDRPLRYTVSATTLNITQVDGPYPCRLRKLTPDSLVFEDPYGNVMRLYKRR